MPGAEEGAGTTALSISQGLSWGAPGKDEEGEGLGHVRLSVALVTRV